MAFGLRNRSRPSQTQMENSTPSLNEPDAHSSSPSRFGFIGDLEESIGLILDAIRNLLYSLHASLNLGGRLGGRALWISIPLGMAILFSLIMAVLSTYRLYEHYAKIAEYIVKFITSTLIGPILLALLCSWAAMNLSRFVQNRVVRHLRSSLRKPVGIVAIVLASFGPVVNFGVPSTVSFAVAGTAVRNLVCIACVILFASCMWDSGNANESDPGTFQLITSLTIIIPLAGVLPSLMVHLVYGGPEERMTLIEEQTRTVFQQLLGAHLLFVQVSMILASLAAVCLICWICWTLWRGPNRESPEKLASLRGNIVSDIVADTPVEHIAFPVALTTSVDAI